MRRPLVLLLTACLCAAPAPLALAQETEEPSLSQTPQTTTEPQTEEPREQPRASRTEELPDTGTDPRLLGLAGMSLLLVGFGMRLRTIPEW